MESELPVGTSGKNSGPVQEIQVGISGENSEDADWSVRNLVRCC